MKTAEQNVTRAPALRSKDPLVVRCTCGVDEVFTEHSILRRQEGMRLVMACALCKAEPPNVRVLLATTWAIYDRYGRKMPETSRGLTGGDAT